MREETDGVHSTVESNTVVEDVLLICQFSSGYELLIVKNKQKTHAG